MRFVEIIILSLLLCDCVSDQKRAAAACTAQARRLYNVAEGMSENSEINEKISYEVVACMGKRGYEPSRVNLIRVAMINFRS
jgi:hypothetical protein